MRIRLRTRDEYMHDIEDAPGFHESMCFHFFDRTARLGGILRVGNQPREGIAEVMACLFLPDGRVACWRESVPISGNESLAAGGLSIEVVQPWKEVSVGFTGELLVPGGDPVSADLELSWKGHSARGFGGELVDEEGRLYAEGAGAELARGHYEQYGALNGTAEVGGQGYVVSALGIRDHSWGPRYWRSPWWYRWITGNADKEFGFAIWVVAERDGGRHVGGSIFEDGEYHAVREARLETGWDDGRPATVKAHVGTDLGAYAISGRVVGVTAHETERDVDGKKLPVRLCDGLTEWTVAGMRAWGMTEHLDVLVEGEPAGRKSVGAGGP